jgi:S-adenosyl methyltransferase
LLIGIVQLIEDTDAPRAIIGRLLDAVPSGSWLALAHPASDVVPEVVTMARHLSQRSVTPTMLRTHAEVTRFFDGLELLPPGVVQLHRWQQDATVPEEGKLMPAYCGLARKP